MIVFEKKDSGNVVVTDAQGNKHKLSPALNVIAHPHNANLIVFSPGTSPQNFTNPSFVADWREIQTPTVTSRNNAIEELSEGFFFSVEGEGGTGIVDDELDIESDNAIANKAVTTVLNQILDVVAEPPTYQSPTASITNVTQVVERGTDLNLTIAIAFNQNDAGEATAYTLQRNSVDISSAQSTPVVEENIQANIVFRGNVAYEQGPVKKNNLDIYDPTGRIQAGNVNSANRTITARFRQFFGAAAAVPENSDAVRSLPANNFDNVNTLNLSTGTTHNRFVVAIPVNKSISNVIDTGNMNVNITGEYALVNSEFPVADIGGNIHNYKLYAMQQANPYSTSTNHQITLS